MATPQDPIDHVVAQWAAERPDLADGLEAMSIFGRLGRAQMLAGPAIEAVYEKHGLVVGDFVVLAALRRNGAPFVLTPTELARGLMLSPAGMTNRIDRLERGGLVERQPRPDDRRSMPVALTATGRKIVDAVVRDHVVNENRLLAGLSKSDRKALNRLLRKLTLQLDSATEQ